MSASSKRFRVRGRMAAPPDHLALPAVPSRPLGRSEWTAAGLFLAFWVALFGFVVLIHDKVPLDEMVTFVVEEEPPPPPPPPPPEEEPPPPKDVEPPKPVPPDPDQPPPPPTPDPPPPQFGIPADGLSTNGDMAVATGNTLMKKADTVVKAAPPPLPPAPMQASYDAQVVKEVQPVYPEWAIDQGVMLKIKVLISLDEQGKVADVRFLNAGQKDFNANIRKSIMASVFKPLIVAGRAVPARFVKEYNFEIVE